MNAPVTLTTTRIYRMSPVPGIAPVDGWEMWTWDEGDSDRFWTAAYTAVRGEEEVDLNLSRFKFSPSQERFAWLVRNGPPSGKHLGPVDDFEIEAAMAAERIAA